MLPTREKYKQMKEEEDKYMDITRTPQPPNFNIIPERTKDPIKGASVWALGNQE